MKNLTRNFTLIVLLLACLSPKILFAGHMVEAGKVKGPEIEMQKR